MAGAWSDAELAASVDAYKWMAAQEAAGEPYSKRKIYSELAERFGRTEKSFEYRMQNISAVLDELGMSWIQGLKPAVNVGEGVRPRLISLVKGEAIKSQTQPQADYKGKLPALRKWLTHIARAGEKVTYGDVMTAFGIDRFSLRHAMDFLGHEAQDAGEPVLTALIVSKRTGACSIGLRNEFAVIDDNLERRRLYEYWSQTSIPEDTDSSSDELDIKATKFASVAVRPSQAAFRRKVFIAYGGKCVITGCDVRNALDAAHRHGRDWRLGHNNASDGLLLRKDLHALYDAKLISVTALGIIELDDKIDEHYGQYAGLHLPAWQ